ncbi:MAG: dNTP triphosphohydrolase, partial [Candidatus Heimdallarchaeota archaeon]|nr:dNTP triphosphohydrolase [Candidatus Heimdallarchaeota archaeon]
MMEWEKLLNQNRLKRDEKKIFPIYVNPFYEDQARITFCQPFRRLHDKTQVHPLSTNDNVRSRLIHSMEVASVGQYLGTIVGDSIVKEFNLPKNITKETFGSVVQAAALAHDIGNPPFGHCGEDAFREYYKHPKKEIASFINKLESGEKKDLANFEGNAQGFRILTQIENHKWNGGLQL